MDQREPTLPGCHLESYPFLHPVDDYYSSCIFHSCTRSVTFLEKSPDVSQMRLRVFNGRPKVHSHKVRIWISARDGLSPIYRIYGMIRATT